MSNTQSIFSEVELELARQDLKWGANHDDKHGPADWSNVLYGLVSEAPTDAMKATTPIAFRRVMIKIAATCINCVKSIDRLFPRLPGVK